MWHRCRYKQGKIALSGHYIYDHSPTLPQYQAQILAVSKPDSDGIRA